MNISHLPPAHPEQNKQKTTINSMATYRNTYKYEKNYLIYGYCPHCVHQYVRTIGI